MGQNGTDKQTDSAIVNVDVNVNLYSASSQKITPLTRSPASDREGAVCSTTE